jgi:hypothetical protein
MGDFFQVLLVFISPILLRKYNSVGKFVEIGDNAAAPPCVRVGFRNNNSSVFKTFSLFKRVNTVGGSSSS